MREVFSGIAIPIGFGVLAVGTGMGITLATGARSVPGARNGSTVVGRTAPDVAPRFIQPASLLTTNSDGQSSADMEAECQNHMNGTDMSGMMGGSDAER